MQLGLGDDVQARAQTALSRKLADLLRRDAGSTSNVGRLDAKGYLTDPATGIVPHQEPRVRRIARFNVVETINDEELSRALDHVAAGAGGELRAKAGERPKFLAAYSSAALAVNCFAPFLGERRLAFEGLSLTEPRLETILEIGGRCRRPNLDLLDPASDRVLAVESKCTEYLKTKKRPTRSDFAWLKARPVGDPYERRTSELAAGPGAIELHSILTQDALAFRHLDATQLLKHYLGLRNEYRDRPATLVYLYWEPENAADIDACRAHEDEIARIRPLLTDASVKFRPLSYSRLWRAWADARDAFLREHAAALADRYSATI
jgi:Restriction Endonuclease associating with ARP